MHPCNLCPMVSLSQKEAPLWGFQSEPLRVSGSQTVMLVCIPMGPPPSLSLIVLSPHSILSLCAVLQAVPRHQPMPLLLLQQLLAWPAERSWYEAQDSSQKETRIWKFGRITGNRLLFALINLEFRKLKPIAIRLWPMCQTSQKKWSNKRKSINY